jgi:Concanavalin A-like lectin/glucanases superfamily/Fibronectin type III domain/Hypothetical glycosyl hydrolase family 15
MRNLSAGLFSTRPNPGWFRSLGAGSRRWLLVSVAVLLAAVLPSARSAGAVSGLPDTTSGVHLALIFNYNEPNTPATMSSVKTQESQVDYVWGADSQATPLHNNVSSPGNAWHEYYIPWSRDESSLAPSYSTISWYKTNHPDWLLYQSDRTTVAYAFGATNVPALDMTNPAVQQFILTNWLYPAMAGGYQGISIDNIIWYNYLLAAGHYSTSGTWVQLYTGALQDSTWATANSQALAAIRTALLSSYPNASITLSQGYDCNFDMTPWPDSLPYLDGIMDEGAFTNGGNSSFPYVVNDANGTICANKWLDRMQEYEYSQKTLGKALVLAGPEPYTVSAYMTDTNAQARFDLQWNLANYLLIKYNHTYFWWGGVQQYGNAPFLQHEEQTVGIGNAAPGIGSPTDDFYASQGVYMRDFTNGLAIVNDDHYNSYTITLPVGKYKDLYGNAVTSYTMSAHSGLVLLLTGSSPSATPTPTSAPTTPPAATPTPTSGTPSSYKSTVLGDGPASYYRLDETSGPTAADVSGNGRNGTYNGAVSFGAAGATVDGDTAISLPGSGTTNVSYPAPGISAGASFSLECWVKLVNNGAGQALFGNAGTSTLLKYITTGTGSTVAGKFGFNSATGDANTLYTNNTYPEGHWYHLVYTWDSASGTESIYVNGVLDRSRTSPPYTPNGSGVGAIGYYSASYPMPLDGTVDEVAIYNKALSATRVQNHYNAGLAAATTPTSTPIATPTRTPAPTSTPTAAPTNTPTRTPAPTNTPVVTVPGGPTNVTATSSGAKVPTVNWLPPASNGGSPITSYTIRAYVGSTTTVATTLTVSGSVQSALVSGLSNGTTYTFTVQAVNVAGPGPESARSNAITPPH